MTKKEFRTSVSTRAKEVMYRQDIQYKHITIHQGLPYISVGEDGCKFYTQGEDAENLLREAKFTADRTGLNIKTCIIWYLDSAGVFN